MCSARQRVGSERSESDRHTRLRLKIAVGERVSAALSHTASGVQHPDALRSDVKIASVQHARACTKSCIVTISADMALINIRQARESAFVVRQHKPGHPGKPRAFTPLVFTFLQF